MNCFSGSSDEPDFVPPDEVCLTDFDEDADGDVDLDDF